MASNTAVAVTKLVPLLERLSLLRINEAALNRVIRCVEFADTIHQIDTSTVAEPMVSPTEQHCIQMRDDVMHPTNLVETIKNAPKTVEDYFVTPSEHKHYSHL